MSGTREHRALVMDGQVMHYFVNGIWQGKRYCTARQGRMWEMRELIIGCKANETEFFRGQIDQLRLSKIARYSDNFTVNSALTSDDSTLALYNFDEGEGDVLKDASGNGHHGKIIGATWVKSNSPVAPPAPRRYDSGEWIDVLSLIDPQADKLAVSGMTGKNDWRKENEELVVAKDEQASKLLMPLDSAWSAFECEIEFTRRAGRGGLNLNIPSQRGECPVVVDHPSGKGGVSLGARNNGVLLTEGVQIETGKRATMRIEVRREQDVDRISVALNGTTVGQWSGDRNQLSKESNEGFPVGRRMSLWIPEGGHEFTVHRIRVRMLDGETATTLRPVPRTLPTDGNAPLAATGWPADAPPPAIAPFNAEQAKQHQAAWAKYLGVPVEYTNSLGMKFRLIPPGEFLMGSSPEEIEAALKEMENSNDKEWRKHWEECVKSEGPQHSVILTQPTYLGIHEVTQADFEKAVGSNPALFKKNALHMEKVEGLDTSKHPLEGVSWNDAIEFCAKLSQQEKLNPWYFRAGESVTRLAGTGYQLPTEAQWEFACRAGATTKFWFGDQSMDLAKASWFRSNSGNRPHPVGELKENSFGLFDVHGNVSEWMQDGWELNYYDQFANKPAIDPDGAPQVGTRRVIRGGAWDSRAYQCRAAFRNSPDTASAYSIGFRVSLPIDAVRQALKLAGPAIPTRASNRPATPAVSDPIDFAAERAAAEWVLANNGSLEIATSPDWQWLTYGASGDAKPLPNEPFVITSLGMTHSQVKSESDLERLTRCRYLENLRISGGTIDSHAIELLTRLPRLKTLTLSEQKNLRTSALPKLGRISTLDYLSITSDMVDDRLEFVRHLPALRTLNIYGPQPPEITLLAEAPQLHTILLTTPDAVEDSKLAEVQARHGQLRIVVGWMGKYHMVGRDPVHEAAKHLVELGVECYGGVNYWQPRTKLLTKADFEDGSVWSFSVSKVPSSVQLSADDREKLKLLDSYHFAAEGQRDADELAKSLSGNHGIANFTLTDCDLTDAGLEHLQKLVSLRFINVTKTKVTPAGVELFHRAVPLCGITSDFGVTLPNFMSVDAARPK